MLKQNRSIAVAGAQFSHSRGTVLSLPLHSSLAAAALHCHGSGRTLRRQSENYATEVAELSR